MRLVVSTRGVLGRSTIRILVLGMGYLGFCYVESKSFSFGLRLVEGCGWPRGVDVFFRR